MPYKDKEKAKEYRRKYYQENKEKINLASAEWKKANPQKRKAIMKKYRKTDKGRKTATISNWKRYGIICDYDAIYDIYINTHKCDFCKKEFENNTERCLDHDHNTGEVRGILCNPCNVKDVLAIDKQH